MTESPPIKAFTFVLFLVVLLAFVAETQTAQYLETTLEYNQPYLIFYIVHSSFIFCFPVHLAYLLLGTNHGLRPILRGLRAALAEQAAAWGPGRVSLPTEKVSLARLVAPIICITAFYSIPALLWFTAVSLSSVTDVTAIWNANAFFAYLFSVKLTGAKWGSLHFSVVALATFGVLTVTYGNSFLSSHSLANKTSVTPAPVVGDMLTLVASLLYGLYQVLYKRYIALPLDAEWTTGSGHSRQSPDCPSDGSGEEDQVVATAIPDATETIYPPPFGLYSNLVTSAIGLCTLLVFWIPIPLLHWYQIEVFRPPPDVSTVLAIASIATTGVIYSAGIMVLLGIWGPIVTSVGNLLTIVLTLVSDLIFGTVTLTAGGLLGAGMIVCAFGVLVQDML